MKDNGLMFKAPLVRAILSGQKTQTRRAFSGHMVKQMRAAAAIGEVSHFLDEGSLQPNDLAYVQQFSPVGQPGDRIYVRETFGYGGDVYTPDLYFRASQSDAPIQGCWHPAIHMRKADARIWLTEADRVRVPPNGPAKGLTHERNKDEQQVACIPDNLGKTNL
ncbi:hypothetical protein [Comamonas testosteroni]|uniref:hypothetical protein n=1 Tax=Comamonas testosteroni TaxID=285 RepID=UPI0006A64122|nr:hypothetical protein [Comamonas testosteroni]KWT68050.1 hypothetical protein APV28_3855 [Comamonas testosteroni]